MKTRILPPPPPPPRKLKIKQLLILFMLVFCALVFNIACEKEKNNEMHQQTSSVESMAFKNPPPGAPLPPCFPEPSSDFDGCNIYPNRQLTFTTPQGCVVTMEMFVMICLDIDDTYVEVSIAEPPSGINLSIDPTSPPSCQNYIAYLENLMVNDPTAYAAELDIFEAALFAQYEYEFMVSLIGDPSFSETCINYPDSYATASFYRVDCTQRCSTFRVLTDGNGNIIGFETHYRNILCGIGACCIRTTKYCKDSNGDIIADTPITVLEGECTTNGMPAQQGCSGFLEEDCREVCDTE